MVITNVNQVVYLGNGSNTSFPFTFRIIDATDIQLLLIDEDGTETDITSDYFVDINTNTVHYPGYAPGSEPAEADQPAPVQTGQKLMIYRKLPITQEKDFGDKWPFYVIELGLDKLTMILQDMWDWLGRCLYVSKGQAYEAGDDFDPTVPLAAGKVICGNAAGDGFDAREAMMEVNGAWDGEGRQIKGVADPTSEQDAATKDYVDSYADGNFMKLQADGSAWEARNLPISNVAGPVLVKDAATKDYVDRILEGYSGQGERFKIFDNVAQMKVVDLIPSQVVATQGYTDINDGGAAVYTIRAKTQDDVDDGGSIIVLDNGNVAELITDGTVNVKQFGAKGNGETDDTTTLKATLQYAHTNALKVYLPKGTYCISEPLHLYQNQTLYGDLADNTTIKSTAPATTNNAIIVLDRTDDYKFNYGEDYHINNIALVSVNNIPYGIYASKAAPYLDFAHLVISNVKTGISIPDTWLSSIKNTNISNIDIGIQLRSQGTSLHLENIYIMTPTTYGYDIHGLSYSEWSNVACDWATENAIAYNFAYGNVTINGLGCESEKCKICIAQGNSTLNITGATLYFPKTDTGDSVFRMNGSVLNITNANITLAGELSQNNTAVGFNLGSNNIINITRLAAPPALAERMSISDSASSSFVHIRDYTSSHSMLGKVPHLGDTNSSLNFYKDIVPYNKKMNTIYGSLNAASLIRMDGADISWNHAAKSGDILINCKPNTGIAFLQCMSDPTVYTLKGTVTAIDGKTITLSDWGFADDTMTAFARNMGTTINTSGLFNGKTVESISETDKTIVLKDASSASSFQIGAKVTYKNNITFLRDEKYKSVQHVLAGKSEDKPTTPVTGMMYFDTTLNKPVWYNGSNWVDANGNNV